MGFVNMSDNSIIISFYQSSIQYSIESNFVKAQRRQVLTEPIQIGIIKNMMIDLLSDL